MLKFYPVASMIFVPQIFHQIWLGTKPIPRIFQHFTKTWIHNHPQWSYQFWDDNNSAAFVTKKYSHLIPLFDSLPYLIQKVDILKYCILNEFGGVYIDMDYECIKSIDGLLTHANCIGLEPQSHVQYSQFSFFLGNAFMATTARSVFCQAILERCAQKVPALSSGYKEMSKYNYVMETTGPALVNDVYRELNNVDTIRLLPPEQISPFNVREAILYRENKKLGYGADKLKDAYAIHHFIGSWL